MSGSAFPSSSIRLADLGWDDAWAATLATAQQLLGPAEPAHRREPGCAVLGAVADGRVSEERLASWRKLRRELDRLAARDDPALRQQLRTEQRRLYREYAQARRQWNQSRKGR